MSFADQIAQAEAPGFVPRGRMCGVKRLVLKLADQPNEIVALNKMLANKEFWPNQALRKALKEEGHELSIRVLEHHRSGDCACH